MRFLNISFLVFLFIVTVSTYNPLRAEAEKWHLTYEADGINIYRRVMEKSRFLEFKAEGNLCGSISEYVSVILDIDKHPNWAPRCMETKNIEKINDRALIIYAVYEGVWPTADRDYAARMTIAAESDISKVRIDVEGVDLPDTLPVASGIVHIPHLKSCWIFEQLSQDLTRVELRAHVDPGGWIPAWLVNWGYRKIPYQFLKNLESQVAKHLNHTPSLANVSASPH